MKISREWLQTFFDTPLPEASVLMIMEPVFHSYREQWGKAFGEVAVQTEEGKQRYIIYPNHTNTLIPSLCTPNGKRD